MRKDCNCSKGSCNPAQESAGWSKKWAKSQLGAQRLRAADQPKDRLQAQMLSQNFQRDKGCGNPMRPPSHSKRHPSLKAARRERRRDAPLQQLPRRHQSRREEFKTLRSRLGCQRRVRWAQMSQVEDSAIETPATRARAEAIKGGVQAKRAEMVARHSALPRSERLGGDGTVEIIPPPCERGTAASASGVQDSASAAAATTPIATIVPKAAPTETSGVRYSAIGEVGSPLTSDAAATTSIATTTPMAS
jgi:hypothetical protein